MQHCSAQEMETDGNPIYQLCSSSTHKLHEFRVVNLLTRDSCDKADIKREREGWSAGTFDICGKFIFLPQRINLQAICIICAEINQKQT